VWPTSTRFGPSRWPVGQFVGGRTIQVPAVVWTRLPIMALTVVRGDDERADDERAMPRIIT
jgi:hypothetical protein